MKIPSRYKHILHFYYGEKECPFVEGSYEAAFWHGEKHACEAGIDKKQTDSEIFNTVGQYVLNAIDAIVKHSPEDAFEEYLKQMSYRAGEVIRASYSTWLEEPLSLPMTFIMIRK